MRKQYFLFILLFPIILISCQPKSSFGKNTLDEILEPEMKVPSATPTSISQEPSSTPTANLLIDPEFWPYQRYNQNSTAAYSQGTWQLLEDPAILWDIEDSELAFMGPLSVAGDLDGDGRAEYVVARRDPNATNSRLSVFNIEDGRILWEKSLDWYYDHCAPIIADLDGDSKLDIVYAEAHLNNPSPKLVALLGSDGSVLWERNLEGGCQSMAIADFDNDGMQEIVLKRTRDNNTCRHRSRWFLGNSHTPP